MASVTNAVSHGMESINGEFNWFFPAESGAICETNINIAAPLRNPTTTEYGINFINLPPPEAPITIWTIPVRTTRTTNAAIIFPSPIFPAINPKALASKINIGGVGELTKPRVPPEMPEAIDKAIAHKRPAIAPMAAETPCGTKSATPKAIDCGKSIVDAAKPPQTSEIEKPVLSLLVKFCIFRDFALIRKFI
jgi:hypothetical protein